MNETFQILHWVDEIIHPQALINREIAPEDLLKLEIGFLNQLKNYREQIFIRTKFSSRRTGLQLRQLVNISNTVYSYLFRLTPASKCRIYSMQLRSIYLNLLIALEKVIAGVRQVEPEAYSKIPLTLYGYSGLKMEIKTTVKDFLIILKQLPIDKKLYDLLERDFFLFINKKEINQSEIDYTTNLIRQIENSNILDTLHLIDKLYLYGFNPGDFFYYYSNELNSKLKDIPSLHDQLLTIIAEQDRFNGLPGSKIKMFPCLAPIDGQLKTFLSKKERHLKEVIDLHRNASKDEHFSNSTRRIKIFLSVPQLALFVRLMLEKGLLAKENIGELFTFFATHFATPQTTLISAESLRKKSTDVEFATAQKLKAHLIGMLNWLNENYNLSNFKGS